MNRRSFLRHALPVSTVPFLLGGYTLRAYGRSPLLEALVGAAGETDHVLVVIQLNGGNDGLNMVIPRDQYGALMSARANIAIAENLVLPLSDLTGLHPAMTGLHSLYQNGKLSVIQSVGYPNPNLSHFRATDIWLTGSDSNVVLTTGWMGRYLDQEYPDFPNGYPNSVMPDPLAIQVGSVVSSGLNGPEGSMGMAITSPTSFYQLLSGGTDTAPDTPAGHELTFIRQVTQQTQQYAVSVKTAATNATNKSPLYPTAGQNSLADQLKIVAQLIAGGLKTRMYVTNLGGFDTHSGQVSGSGGTETGTHATLLGKLSAAVAAFMDDCSLLGIEQRVIGFTFSEFGRRIKSNASLGTDHGTAAPMFAFGGGVTGGILGANPSLPPNAASNDNIAMQFDFRSVYASVLRDWFNVESNELQLILPNQNGPLPVIVSASGGKSTIPKEYALGQNYPNPFNPDTTIGFNLPRTSTVLLEVYDLLGRSVATLVDGEMPAGSHSVQFHARGLASGTYIYRLRADEYVETRKLMLLR
jgi:uncharacterized protein (DUF1501 family)